MSNTDIGPPRPYCSTHCIYHPPSKDCKYSEEDQARVDAYEAEIRSHTYSPFVATEGIPAWAKLDELERAEKISRRTRERYRDKGIHQQGD